MARLERLATPRSGGRSSPPPAFYEEEDAKSKSPPPSLIAKKKGLDARMKHEREHLRRLEQMRLDAEAQRIYFRKRKNRKQNAPDMDRIGNLSKPRVNFYGQMALKAEIEEIHNHLLI